jgi:hypothetical protein
MQPEFAQMTRHDAVIGQVLPVLLENLEDGLLPSAGLRRIAGYLDTLAIDLQGRAAEIDRFLTSSSS